MNPLVVVVLIGLLPGVTSLNCYFCLAGTSGCNDPFTPNSNGVNTTSSSSYTHCMKIVTAGVVTRSGTMGCIEIPFVLNTGTKCCTTDLCNAAQTNIKNPILILLSLAIALWKFY